jgi:hypothetical protein
VFQFDASLSIDNLLLNAWVLVLIEKQCEYVRCCRAAYSVSVGSKPFLGCPLCNEVVWGPLILVIIKAAYLQVSVEVEGLLGPVLGFCVMGPQKGERSGTLAACTAFSAIFLPGAAWVRGGRQHNV